MSELEIAQRIDALEKQQLETADDAIWQDRPKESRVAARIKYYVTAGEILGLATVLQSLQKIRHESPPAGYINSPSDN
jgi:hypothetical protein